MLTGALDLATASEPPRLDVELIAKRVQIDDFTTGKPDAPADVESGSAEAGSRKEAAGGRPLLSPEVLHAVDAKIDVRIEQVLSGEDELGSGALTAQLGDGRFAVEPLTLELPGGSADLAFALEAHERGLSLETRAEIERLDYGILARRIDPASTTGGIVSLDMELETRGPDMARVMEGANGHLDFGLWPQDLNARLFELWAVNVITALMEEVDKDDASKVNCVIVRFKATDGLLQQRVIYADTTKMRVEGQAEVDFRGRTLDVKAKPKGKRPEFFSLAVPVGLSGEFDDFGLDINPVVLTGKAISFVTSPLHVPIRRIFRKKEPADGQEACAAVWSEKNPEDLGEVLDEAFEGAVAAEDEAEAGAPGRRATTMPADEEPAIDVLNLDQ